MISERLSNLSCSEPVFKSETQIYQEALKLAGYKENLVYKEHRSSNLPKRKSRSKNVTWFNPPFSESVKTNVGVKFLALVEKHFKNTELRKYFNRSTVKISYSCLPNLSAIIAGANKKVIKEYMSKDNIVKECNCRGGSKKCPLGGFCQEEEIVYKAEVKTDDKSHSYLKKYTRTTPLHLIISANNILPIYRNTFGI